MDSFARLIRKSINIYIFQLFALPLGYLTRILFANKLSTVEFGLFYALFELFSLFAFLINFGAGEAFSYFFPKMKKENNFHKIYLLIFIVLAIQITLYVIIAAIARFYALFLMEHYFNLQFNVAYFNIMVVFFFFMIIYITLQEVLVSLGQEKDYALFDFLRNLGIFIISFIILNYFTRNLIAIFLIYLVSTLVIIIFQIRRILKKNQLTSVKIKVSDTSTLKTFFKFSIGSFLSGAAITLFTKTDIVFLTKMQGVEIVGAYTIAIATIALSTALLTPLNVLLLPEIASYDIKKEKTEIQHIVNPIYNVGLFLLIPISIFISIFSDRIIYLLFGSAHLSSILPLRILSIGFIFAIIFSINDMVISGLGHIKLRSVVIFTCLIINCILNFLFIRAWGIVGAAIATSLSYFLLFVITYYVLYKKINFRNKNILRILLLNLLFIPIFFINLNMQYKVQSLFYLVAISGIFLLIYSILGIKLQIINIKTIKEFILKIKASLSHKSGQ